MKQYFSYFKLKFMTEFQYRGAALAGIGTQFFFGFIFTMVYVAFFESENSSSPMKLQEIISYLWLNQSFFALIYLWYKDTDFLKMVRNGDIAYELCRPQNFYLKWYIKMYTSKLASVLLRFLPVILISLILPKPYNLGLPISLEAFVYFLILLILSSFLVTAIIMIFHLISFYLLDSKGIINIFMVVGDIMAGGVIPLPFFPKFLRIIAEILPFQYVLDVPFRIYSGSIATNVAFINIYMSILWIFIITYLGYILSTQILRKCIVQGG